MEVYFKMGIAQNLLLKAKGKINEIKAERKADVVAKKLAKKKSKAEYRKEFVEQSKKTARDEAKKDAMAGGRFKRKVKELKAKNKTFSKKRDMSFLSIGTNDSSKSQGDNARDKLTLREKVSRNPFEL